MRARFRRAAGAVLAGLLLAGPAAAQDMGASDPARKALWRTDSAAAYAEAERRIRDMPEEGAGQDLHLYDLRALDRIPPSVSRLNRLATVLLSGTAVSDLRPLTGMQRLRFVSVTRTRVADLTPLLSLPALKTVDLIGAPAQTDARTLDLLEARGVELDVRDDGPGLFEDY